MICRSRVSHRPLFCYLRNIPFLGQSQSDTSPGLGKGEGSQISYMVVGDLTRGSSLYF